MLDLRFDSRNCQNCLSVKNARGIIIKTRTGAENYFCLECWHELESKYIWVGVLGIVVLTELGFSSPMEILVLIHRLFGKQFHWLIPIDQGFILQGNETKVEQPSLFELA